MNDNFLVQMFFSLFAMNLPTLIICIVAILVILSRGKPATPGSLWALWGFGLALALCLIIPLAQAAIQNWAMSGDNRVQRVWAFTTASGLWSVLHSVVYVFLLMAIIARRPASPTPERH